MASGNHLLIDADIPLYKVASVTETVIDWGDEVVTASCNMEDAVYTFTTWLDELLTNWPEEVVKVTLAASSKTNFRKKLWPDYKGHRISRKPIGYSKLKAWAQKEYGMTIVPDLEADDVLGILATSDPRSVIVSTDKDFLGVPCRFYNPDKDFTVETSPEEADYFHMYQTLVGDPADGYKGCPGIGDVRATKLLADTPREEWWSLVVGLFEAKGLTEEDALLNARMARILRKGEWDPKKKEPILWTPDRLSGPTTASASGAGSTASARAETPETQRSAE